MNDFLKGSQARFWQAQGKPFKRVDPDEVRQIVPMLGTSHPNDQELVAGLINEPPIDSSGDIHAFCNNLQAICLQKGVQIKTNVGVKKILVDEKRIQGLLCDDDTIEKGDIYVLATGIMSNPLGRSIGINLPVYPLKGNIITVPVKVGAHTGHDHEIM